MEQNSKNVRDLTFCAAASYRCSSRSTLTPGRGPREATARSAGRCVRAAPTAAWPCSSTLTVHVDSDVDGERRRLVVVLREAR